MQEQAHSSPGDEEEFFDDEFARVNFGAADEEDARKPSNEYIPYDAFPRVPRELKQRDQWVNWHQEEGRKIPLNPRTLGNAGVGYENSWTTYAYAAHVAATDGLGIGFVLTEQDPYICIDLDKVIEGRELQPYAREILDAMTGYVELSPSGTGLHVWVKSREFFNRRTQGIEVYSDHRWMTVTGRANPRVPAEIPDRTEQVRRLIDERFPRPEPAIFTHPKTVEQDDAALWQRLFATKNGNFLQALYDGDLSVVKDDHSRGVIMLANMLAVYTHSDAARMESLLGQTKLVNDKWHEKRGNLTWIQFQIQDAIDFVNQREVARKARGEENIVMPADGKRDNRQSGKLELNATPSIKPVKRPTYPNRKSDPANEKQKSKEAHRPNKRQVKAKSSK